MDAGQTVAPGRHPRFDALFAFRRLIDSRAYGPAWEAAQELIDGEYPELFYRTMLSELGRAALYGATDPAAAIERLDLLAGRIDGGNTLPEGIRRRIGSLYAFFLPGQDFRAPGCVP